MNKTISVLGAMGAVILLGSFFVKDVPQDVMRLLGVILLFVYFIYKITRRNTTKNDGICKRIIRNNRQHGD